MEKLWVDCRLRLTEQMAQAVRILAHLEDRTIGGEIRHLIGLALDQEYERVRKRKLSPKFRAYQKRFLQTFGEDGQP